MVEKKQFDMVEVEWGLEIPEICRKQAGRPQRVICCRGAVHSRRAAPAV